eukprot:7377454-Prymnesium_polylepis.1
MQTFRHSQPPSSRRLGSFLHARMHSGTSLVEVDVLVLTNLEMLIQCQVIPHGRVVLTPGNRKRRVPSPGHGALEECKPAVRDHQL